MKAWSSLAVVTAIACAPMLSISRADASTVSIPATNAGYFYSAGIDKPEVAPAAPPNATAGYADGVAAGNLAVAASGGQEDKVSFLYFDVLEVPEGATITKSVLTLEVIPNSPPTNISYQASADKVAACRAGDKGFSGDDGAGLANNAPARLCTSPTGFSAKGVAKSATQWQWDITGLVKTWLSGSNDGVALTRLEEVASSFQVVFGAMETAKLSIEYAAASAAAGEVIDAPPVDPAPFVDNSTGEVPADLGSDYVAAEPVAIPATPDVEAPQPVVTTEAAASRRLPLSTSLRPTRFFWFGALALVALLAFVALAQGRPRRSQTPRDTSRLARALADQGRAP